MNYIESITTHSNSLLFNLSNIQFPINPGFIIGIMLLLGVLICVLTILLIKSIHTIRDLGQKINDSNKNDDTNDRPIDSNISDGIDNARDSTIDSRINAEKDTRWDESDYSNIPDLDKIISINDELEPFGFAYDSDSGDFYSIMHPWQRDFGYCKLYDETAPTLSMIFDCEPIYFDYNDKHWLIEFWKGQYGITTGAEVGVYNTKDDSLNIPGLFNGTFYNAVDDSERLNIGFSLVKDNKVLSMRKGLHWWLTSFTLGEFSQPDELTMYIEIHFPNVAMRDAFTDGLIDTGYTTDDFSIQNNIVYIVFDIPYSTQPFTRTSFTQDIMQNNNKQNVDLYQNSTKAFTSVIDKLYYLRQKNPDYFNEVVKIGRPKQLFGIYDTIKSYLD